MTIKNLRLKWTHQPQNHRQQYRQGKIRFGGGLEDEVDTVCGISLWGNRIFFFNLCKCCG